MAAVHGSKASFWLGTAASPAVTVDVSGFANTFGVPFNRDNAETTTMKKTSKTYVPGLKDATVPFSGPYDTGSIEQQMWDLFDQGTIVNFEYYPAGKSVTGTAKYAGSGFLTTYEINSDVGDVDQMTAEFQVTGDVVRTVQP
jgi:hypothetical protein